MKRELYMFGVGINVLVGIFWSILFFKGIISVLFMKYYIKYFFCGLNMIIGIFYNMCYF